MLNLNIAVLSFGVFQSALLSFALLRKKNWHPSNTWLITFLVVIGLQLMFKLMSKAWLWDHARTVYMMSYYYAYAIGPLLYLFFRSKRTKVLFRRNDWLHFIPFVIEMIRTIADEEFKLIYESPLTWLIPWPSMMIISMIVYGYLSWSLMDKSNQHLRQFLFAVVAIETIILFTMQYLVNFGAHPSIKLVFMLLTGLIYWLTYKLLAYPDDFITSGNPPVVKLVATTTPKYANSGLRKEEQDRILSDLKKLIEIEKIFLLHDLTLDEVSKRLSVSKHHLSQVINQNFHVTFTDLMYSWRLDQAQQRLSDPKFGDEKISAIAFDLGFSSVSAFTTMFRKKYHFTPSVYRNQSQIQRKSV